MSRFLGIDYGNSNIGLATSDAMGFLASEYDTIKMSKNIFKDLNNIVDKESVEKIIVGLPISMRTGEDTEQTTQVREFVEDLEKYIGVPIELVDERLTSKIALKMPSQKKCKYTKDSFAAMLILQSYLDQRN